MFTYLLCLHLGKFIYCASVSRQSSALWTTYPNKDVQGFIWQWELCLLEAPALEILLVKSKVWLDLTPTLFAADPHGYPLGLPGPTLLPAEEAEGLSRDSCTHKHHLEVTSSCCHCHVVDTSCFFFFTKLYGLVPILEFCPQTRMLALRIIEYPEHPISRTSRFLINHHLLIHLFKEDYSVPWLLDT